MAAIIRLFHEKLVAHHAQKNAAVYFQTIWLVKYSFRTSLLLEYQNTRYSITP